MRMAIVVRQRASLFLHSVGVILQLQEPQNWAQGVGKAVPHAQEHPLLK